MEKDKLKEKLFQMLFEVPLIFNRKEAGYYFKGFVTSNSLAKAAAKGQGPPHYKINGKMYYEKNEFIEWLLHKATGTSLYTPYHFENDIAETPEAQEELLKYRSE